MDKVLPGSNYEILIIIFVIDCWSYCANVIQIIFHLNSSAGTGCLVISVEAAARRKAKVVGKPERIMFDCINSR